MTWEHSVSRIRERLPELERQILKFGEFFPLRLLPAGLFRDVTSGADCLADIYKDLDVMTPAASEKVVTYWSERLSRKIHVLVHICRTEQQNFKDRPKFDIDRMGTRTQWIEHIQSKHAKLSTQRAALVTTLELMQSRQDVGTIQVQKELNEIDVQLSGLFI